MRILFVGSSITSNLNQAGMIRVLSVAKLLKEMQHEVDIVSVDRFNSEIVKVEDIEIINAFPSIFKTNRLIRFIASFGFGFWCLSKYLKFSKKKYDYVYCYGSELSWALSAYIIAKLANARTIFDITEWYDFYGTYTNPLRFLQRLSSWAGVIVAVPLLANKIIVPSTRYILFFNSFGKNASLLVPFFFSDSKLVCDTNKVGLNIVYAGIPHGKDDFGLIVNAINCVCKSGYLIKFNVYGIDSNQLKKILDFNKIKIAELSENLQLTAYGQVSHKAAMDAVASGDFQIIIREPSRRVNYGFPSKFGESLLLGTPLITNDFSDIKNYVIDGVDSLIIDTVDIVKLEQALSRACDMDEQDKIHMRMSAYAKGQKYFSSESAMVVLRKIIAA